MSSKVWKETALSSEAPQTLSRPKCRICFCGKSKGKLISPCNCKGSLGLVHRQCMEKWLGVKQTNRCELCKTKLRVKTVNGGFKDWMFDRNNANRRLMIFDLICFLILIPAIVVSFDMCINGVVYYSQSVWDTISIIAVIVLLLSSFTLWIIVCFGFYFNAFSTWRANNFKVSLKDTKKLISPNLEDGKVSRVSRFRQMFRDSDIPPDESSGEPIPPQNIETSSAQFSRSVALHIPLEISRV